MRSPSPARITSWSPTTEPPRSVAKPIAPAGAPRCGRRARAPTGRRDRSRAPPRPPDRGGARCRRAHRPCGGGAFPGSRDRRRRAPAPRRLLDEHRQEIDPEAHVAGLDDPRAIAPRRRDRRIVLGRAARRADDMHQPAPRRLKRQRHAGGGAVKSITPSASRSAASRSSDTGTPSAATPASVPASLPRWAEPGRSTAAATANSGASEARRTSVRPMRPPARGSPAASRPSPVFPSVHRLARARLERVEAGIQSVRPAAQLGMGAALRDAAAIDDEDLVGPDDRRERCATTRTVRPRIASSSAR